jgi:hypothetical protein
MTNVTSDFFVSNFRFKFEFEGNGGNNFYLDDINIYSGAPSNDIVLGLNDGEAFLPYVVLYPNPVENQLNLAFQSGVKQKGLIHLFDVFGRKIKTAEYFAEEGKNEVWMSLDELSTGLYRIEFILGESRKTLSFLKQ